MRYRSAHFIGLRKPVGAAIVQEDRVKTVDLHDCWKLFGKAAYKKSKKTDFPDQMLSSAVNGQKRGHTDSLCSGDHKQIEGFAANHGRLLSFFVLDRTMIALLVSPKTLRRGFGICITRQEVGGVFSRMSPDTGSSPLLTISSLSRDPRSFPQNSTLNSSQMAQSLVNVSVGRSLIALLMSTGSLGSSGDMVIGGGGCPSVASTSMLVCSSSDMVGQDEEGVME